MSEHELTEAQERYNVAQYELFQLGAYGHCTYTNGEMLTKEGKRKQQDYNDRLHSARMELESALLVLVAEKAESFRGDWGIPATWLRSLANDPDERSVLAAPDDEVIVAYADPGVPEVLLCLADAKLADPVGGNMSPRTSEDLSGGGICTRCGVDVLIPQLPGRVPIGLDSPVTQEHQALERVRRLHDSLVQETDLASPGDEITRDAAARLIAVALDGWSPPPSGRASEDKVEGALRDVLAQIRPQGHPGWKLNTCLVTDDQVDRWRQVAGLPSIARRDK